MSSPGLEPSPYATAVSFAKHYTGWAIIIMSFVRKESNTTDLSGASIRTVFFHSVREEWFFFYQAFLQSRYPACRRNGDFYTVIGSWGDAR
ncbi:hypothetical protein TNCV_3735131 [Trichonephila clavipes]|nr:hypothetical protein TNCV_3735131 [Trichonephila clavipes]